MLRLLLLSDIHFIHCEDDENDFRALETAFIEAMDSVRDTGGVNQILICGDIANKGQKSEYKKTEVFLKKVFNRLKCDEKQTQVYVVPGNHDINRNTNMKTRLAIRPTLLDTSNADDFIYEAKHSEIDTLKMIYSPLCEYHRFANSHSSLDGIAEAIFSGAPNFNNRSFRKEVRLGILDDYIVKLHCLNSALISDKEDVNDPRCMKKGEHKLYMPKYAYNIDTDSTFINISMMHHPISWFNNEEIMSTEFDKRFKLQLFGHVHTQSIHQEIEGKSAIRLQLGSLQPGKDGDVKKYPPLYNVMEIDVVRGVLKVTVICYSWNEYEFVRNEDFSYVRKVTLKRKDRRTAKQKNEVEIMKSSTSCPDNIYALRYRFFNSEHIKEVICEIMPKAYDEDKEEYINAMLFFKSISSNNGIIKQLETALTQYGD